MVNQDTTDATDKPVALPSAVSVGPRRSWVLMILGAAMLLSGVALGVGGAMLWLRGDGGRARLGQLDRPAARIAAEIAGTCDLSKRQTRQVREIIARRLEVLREIRQEMVDAVLAEHETLRGEMKEVLDDRQFRRWSRRLREVQERGRLLGPRQISSWVTGLVEYNRGHAAPSFQRD